MSDDTFRILDGIRDDLKADALALVAARFGCEPRDKAQSAVLTLFFAALNLAIDNGLETLLAEYLSRAAGQILRHRPVGRD